MPAIATSQKERGALPRVESSPLQRRDSVRHRAFLKARILIQDRTTMDCMVRNMSLSGARLEVSQNFILPAEFELEIPQRGSVLLCALKWRKDDAVGVKFLDSKGPIRRAPSANFMKKIRRENAQLREAIGRLSAHIQALKGEA
jgi:PilZ domain